MNDSSKDNVVETDLIISFNKGNVHALEKIIQMYQKELMFFALKITQNRESAEEIINDCFLKVWNKRERLKNIKDLKGYLYVSVKNSCLDFLKSPKNDFSNNIQADNYIIPSLENIEAKLIYSELLGILMREIDKLPEKQKKVFRLSYLEGLSVK